MMKNIINVHANQLITPLLVVLAAAAMRLLPHPPNVAPIAAMALFGGIYLDKKHALVIPLMALFLSDAVIGVYPGMIFVYGSFFLIGLIGLFIKNHLRPLTLISASCASSLLFFVITNFGVWMSGNMYPKTFSGLMSCYTLALPFFRNTIIGDLLYMGVFVIGYQAILQLKTHAEPAPLPQNEE